MPARSRGAQRCRPSLVEASKSFVLRNRKRPAAWDGSLHVAMAGLQALTGTTDEGLQQGFENGLTSIKQAHLEGLRRPANASRGARRASVSPAPASQATVHQARPPAGGASREVRGTKEELATYLLETKVSSSTLIELAPHRAFAGVGFRALGALVI